MKANLCAIALLATSTPFAVFASTYLDATGDSATVPSLDITSIFVSNDATALSLHINLAGDPMAADWGKYLIGFDTIAGGNTTGPDAWGNPITMSVGGMDYFIGSWLDFGTGATVFGWSGTSWNLMSSTGIGVATSLSSVTLSLNLSTLGLSEGSMFNFDIYSTAIGNSVLDAAGSSTALTWNNNPYDSGVNVLTYTVTAVPEPSAFGVMGLGALLLAWRGRHRPA